MAWARSQRDDGFVTHHGFTSKVIELPKMSWHHKSGVDG